MNVNTLLISHWRSGSNLLASIFMEHFDFYYLDDYFMQLSFDKMIGDKNLESKNHSYNKILNHYLFQLVNKAFNKKTLLKLMPPDLSTIDPVVKNSFPIKILLYRKNLFATAKSFALAKTTGIFFEDKEKTQFVGNLDTELFKEICTDMLNNYNTLINYNPEVDYIFEYESDLIPYVTINPTSWKKHRPAIIYNTEDLQEICDEVFSKEKYKINDFFENKKLQSQLSIDMFFEILARRFN